MLTVLLIPKKKATDKRQELADGKIGGLFLVIQPSGAKSWAVRYRAEGAPRKYTIGSFPEIDLAETRRRAHRVHIDIGNGN